MARATPLSFRQRPVPRAGDFPSDNPTSQKGRGARSNISGRYEREQRETIDDGWPDIDLPKPLKTTIPLGSAAQDRQFQHLKCGLIVPSILTTAVLIRCPFGPGFGP